MTAATTELGRRNRYPLSLNLLMVWHGLFAGAYTIAFLTGDLATDLHRFAGYLTAALLALRLAIAIPVAPTSVWALPWPSAILWREFLGRLLDNPIKALAGRWPGLPLSGLAVLVGGVLAVLTGLAADSWHADDLHEGLANLSLVAVSGHIALIALGHALRRTGKAENRQ